MTEIIPVVELLKNSNVSGDTQVVFTDEYQTEIARGHMRGLRCAARCPESCRDLTLSMLLGLYAVDDRVDVVGPYKVYTIRVQGCW